MCALRVWCTDCDVNMEQSGTAMDCPTDGDFFICPGCGHRVVVFEGEE